MRALVLASFVLGACESSDNAVNQVFPDLVVLPESVDFGDVAVGYSQGVPVQIANAGLASLKLDSLEITGEGAEAFAVAAPDPDALAADENETVTVTFTPPTYLPYAATLEIASNDPTHPVYSIPLTGTGVYAPSPDLVVDPLTLDFGTVAAGDVAYKTLALRNDGAATLTLGNAAQHGSGAFAIVGEDPSGYSIPPGQTQQVVWAYSPTTDAGDNGTWLIPSDDPTEPSVTLTLLGNGGGDFAYPEADIVCPDTIVPRQSVALDGRGSTEPAGLPLTYAWTLEDKPDGSAVDGLLDSTLDVASFTPDLAGEYTVGLVVQNPSGVASAKRICRMNAIPKEDLHVELVWNTSSADLDLHLIANEGELYSTPDDCTWCDTHPDWGVTFDTDDDGSYDLDAIHGFGPENINVDAPADGRYRIVVHYFDDHGDKSVVATVKVFAFGTLIAEAQQTMDYNYTWEVGYVNWPEGTLGATGIYQYHYEYDADGNPVLGDDGKPVPGPRQCSADVIP